MQRMPETGNPDAPVSCLADNYYYWDVGKELCVKFLNGSPTMHKKIMDIAKQWEQYGNLTFRLVDSGPAHIRIRLQNNGYISSMLGMMANIIPENQANVFIDTSSFSSMSNLQAIVLHLFGHILGFQHEIKVPLKGRVWNRNIVDRYFRAFGWSREDIQTRIIDVYSVSYSNGLVADPVSVMNIPLPTGWTGEKAADWKPNLSEGDKKLMQLIYPDSTIETKERSGIAVTDFKGIKIAQTESGFIFYPQLMLTVKNVKGLRFNVFLVTEDGDIIYNALEEPVAASLSYPGNGDKVYAINKTANDFGFFIAFDSIPVKYRRKNLKVFFSIDYVDMDYQQNKGYRSTPQDFVWKP